MALQPIDNTTTTYKTDNQFYLVDIVENYNGRIPCYEAYIYNIDYGVKMLMFGTNMNRLNRANFLAMVADVIPEYERTYYDLYMTED